MKSIRRSLAIAAIMGLLTLFIDVGRAEEAPMTPPGILYGSPETFIEKANFTSDQRIKKNFRTATLTFDVSAPYSGEKAIASAAAGSQEEIKRLIDEIDKDLTTSLAFSK